MSALNDWSLDPAVFSWLKRNTPRMCDVLELGSGAGSRLLIDTLDLNTLTSVEHDPEYVRPSAGTHRYIHAPIRDGWYDVDTLRAKLIDPYHYIIVDGPPGSIGRGGFREYLDLFNDVPILFDDVHRRAEFDLASAVAQVRKKSISIHYLTNGRAFATVGWPL